MKWIIYASIMLSILPAMAQSEQANGQQQRHQGRPHGPRPNLTDEQIACLESKLGKPGEGERPTEEAFKQAHADCGITLPERKSDDNQ